LVGVVKKHGCLGRRVLAGKSHSNARGENGDTSLTQIDCNFTDTQPVAQIGICIL
jgi:hypothetical protein